MFLAACGSSGGSSSSSVPIPFEVAVLGTWSMVTQNGQSCPGCIVATFWENRTGTLTINSGGIRATIDGTWSYSNGYLTVRDNSGALYETSTASISGSTLYWGVNTYTKQ